MTGLQSRAPKAKLVGMASDHRFSTRGRRPMPAATCERCIADFMHTSPAPRANEARQSLCRDFRQFGLDRGELLLKVVEARRRQPQRAIGNSFNGCCHRKVHYRRDISR